MKGKHKRKLSSSLKRRKAAISRTKRRKEVVSRKKHEQEDVKPIHPLIRLLTPTQERILEDLRVSDIFHVAQSMNLTESTVSVHLHRIRKKYKLAKAFVNRIEGMANTYPSLRKYLKTREPG